MESHSIFMKLKTFLQISFCKRPSFCNNHDVLAVSCQFPLAGLPIFPDSSHQRKYVRDSILLTHSFLENSFKLNRSQLRTQNSIITLFLIHNWNIFSLKASLFLDLEVFVSSCAAERVLGAGVLNRLTVGLCAGWGLVTACHSGQSQDRSVPDQPIRGQWSAASS